MVDFSGRLLYPVLVRPVIDGLAAVIGDNLRSSFAPGDDAAWELFKVARAFLGAGGPPPAEARSAVTSAFLPYVSPARRDRGAQMLADLGDAASFAASPPKLLKALIEVDRRKGTALSWRYLEGASRVAELTCQLDGRLVEAERRALEGFDRVARAEIEAAGVRWVRASPLASLANVVRGNVSTDLASLGKAGEAIRGAVDELKGNRPERPEPEGGDLFAELDALVGLETVKRDVKQLANFIRVQGLRREQGLSTQETTKHLVFTGNPGTGKTTVARVLARLYRRLGVVTRGHLVETDRGGLIGGYLGQTALKTKAVFGKAQGGVLFLDEAYSLARGEGTDIYAHEAVDTLVKLMEDHRQNVVVIAAGYTDEMETFLEANPGLRSRFKRVIHFPDYSDEELVRIFVNLCEANQYRPSPAALEKLRLLFANLDHDKGFGNGRLVRNLFEAAVAAQSDRLVELPSPSREEMTTLEAEDIQF